MSTAGVEQDPERLAREAAHRQWQQRSGNGNTDWPDPEPLIAPIDDEEPYPVDALPDPIRGAVEEYRPFGQQPVSLIAGSALSAVSLACQGLADIGRDRRLVNPLSLGVIVIAGSGERKTAADQHFAQPIRRWEQTKNEEWTPRERAASDALGAWNAEREGLLGKIKSAAGGKKAGDIEQLKAERTQLAQRKPALFTLPRLFYEDVNAEILAVKLAEGWPSASLWSDEGGLVVGSHGMSDENLMRFVGLLNRLWDGRPFERLRLTTKSARIRGRRFTTSLMMQPIVLARLLAAGDGAARNMGFLARNLLAWPASTIGKRPYVEPPDAMPAIEAFGARLRGLLDTDLPLQDDALVPPILNMSPAAKTLWTEFFNDVEAAIARTGEFGDVPDVGAKIAENASRLAGNFHVFQYGPGGDIAEQEIEGATAVAGWHLNEARRVVGSTQKPEEIADAELMLSWLLKRGGTISPKDILRLGPPQLRDRKRRDAALQVLADKHWIFLIGNPSRIILNPKATAA